MFTGLFEVYEAVRSSPRLGDVPAERHAFGALADLPVAAAPRITWLPTTDSYAAPLPVAAPALVGGRRVEVESIKTRRAGVDIELIVPAGPQGYRALEDLLRRVHLALRDVLLCDGNYSIGRGRWVDRTKVSTGTLGYVQPVEVYVQIYDVVGAQLWEETNVALRP